MGHESFPACILSGADGGRIVEFEHDVAISQTARLRLLFRTIRAARADLHARCSQPRHKLPEYVQKMRWFAAL
jgi:hypothetical protein